jgi:hypothetical protein
MKYVFLYNLIGEDYEYEDLLVEKIYRVVPEMKILDECRYNVEINGSRIGEGRSIWVPEDKYLIAWTVANYEDLLGINLLNFNHQEYKITADDGVEWFENHRNDDFYIKEF